MKDLQDVGSIPGSGRVGNSNLLQYSCLENPKDRGAWWATVHGSQRDMTEHTYLLVIGKVMLYPICSHLLNYFYAAH